MRIKLTLSYDGTDFAGWQRQSAERTVQQEIEQALAKIHKGKDIVLHGAGRTDSGVHASAQVAHFDSDHASISPEIFKKSLNANLPRDIRILKSERVADDFHARFDAQMRSYKYYILNQEDCWAYYRDYVYSIDKEIKLTALNEAASILIGNHNFRTFASKSERDTESYVRDIFAANWYCEGMFLVFHISGAGFLRKMVRSIVGNLLEVNDFDNPKEELARRFYAKDRKESGVTAPAHGLYLHEVSYDGMDRGVLP